MKELVKSFEDLPKIAKVILSIPCLDIIWAIVRIIKGVAYKNAVTLIAGILWIFPGCFICWLADIICAALGRDFFFMQGEKN